MPAVSVIVPVFNGRKHIREIAGYLDSQDFEDFEVIFSIDVRSDDGTMEEASKVCSEKDRFRCVYQTDEDHLAGARNRGYHSAKGDFIWFCDVDDAPSPHFISVMYGLQQETDADMVVCNFVNVKPGKCVPESRRKWNHQVFDRAEALRMVSTHEFPVSTWTKLFRKSILDDNGILFTDSKAEDIEHLYLFMKYASCVCVTDRPLYAYRLTDGSICRDPKNFDERGWSEIQAYRLADGIWKDSPDAEVILRHNALLRMRSSGHMTLSGFLEYHEDEGSKEDYKKYFSRTPEGWLYHYFPRVYHTAIRFYIRHVYKRDGSYGMKMLKK